MEITRSTQETVKGPADWFTGDVDIDAIAANPDPSRVQALTSTSRPEPGPRGIRIRSARPSS